MGKTMDNLAAAFAGESQANRKYLAFAKKADQEGFGQIAKLFRAAAEAETVHAHGHLRAMGGIKDTKANLQESVVGESHEFKVMYPEFIATAKEEGEKTALKMFEWANEVEEIHHGLYEQAAAAIEAGNDLPSSEIHVCSVCGNTVIGACPDKCSVCGVPGSKFEQIS
ncbi:MAG: rubrerythrin family protein [Deltaproteobacteria bacterium]|nr:rubrerythrin family protein [Candidatus Anaeroferrophillus wilburensis]MBN2889825.1 rubrerythrin family protein [Deltaproteobacteria bacterium]